MPEKLRTLVVGLGRAGAGLHLPVLAKARERQPEWFAPDPVVAYDQDAVARACHAAEGLRTVASLAHAAREMDPERTVVHVCTPPVARVALVEELLERGFRRLLVEKPLASGPRDLARLLDLLRRPGVQAAVVAPWLASTLTDRLTGLVRERSALGRLRQISVVQNKPRFRRSLATTGHPTAFDVEVPHAMGVLLRLAGDADVAGATCADLDVNGRRLPRIGGATLRLAHHGGVRSVIRSDLTSPVRERRITLRFDQGTAIGHYPAEASDHYAQLRLLVRDAPVAPRAVFRDDALTEVMLRSYTGFATGGTDSAAFAEQARVVGLLSEAKELAFPHEAPEGAEAQEELAGVR
ncbi:Gfo/Idh/MocA family oxidoreductase [Streptomyces sp. NPDC021224]|uniref:Gfo/Idh/MocA family oxidoreductase n=1 Tax=unclassified Streptomyces TaxID=2593676 RepID=UPI0037ABBCDF